jgi:hypothetical protein
MIVRQTDELKDGASRRRFAARRSLVLDFAGLTEPRSAMRFEGTSLPPQP